MSFNRVAVSWLLWIGPKVKEFLIALKRSKSKRKKRKVIKMKVILSSSMKELATIITILKFIKRFRRNT